MSHLLCYALLGANVLGAACYLVFQLCYAPKADPQKAWILFVFLLACPVLAPCFLGLGNLLRLLFRAQDDAAPETPAGEGMIRAVQPELETEMNIVSMEEAMIVSHKSDLRRMLLNLLKDGTDNSLSAIAMALDSDDSEASHYSASAIADSLTQFHSNVLTMQDAIDADEKNVAGYSSLIEYLLWYLDKNVLSDRELKLYIDKTADVTARLLALEPGAVTPAFYLGLVSLYIKVGGLSSAKKWAEEIAARCPETLEAYTANLRYHFAAEDVEGFNQWLSRLKSSRVVVNKEIMDIIHTLG